MPPVGALLKTVPRGPGFGNARFVRTLFERAMGRQALRLTTTDSLIDPQALRLLLPQDLPEFEVPGADLERNAGAGNYL